jgi:sugar phosphate isomerase/epimerase
VRRAVDFAVAAGAARVAVRTDPEAGLGQSRRRDRFLGHAAALATEAAAAGVTLALENFHDPVPLFLSLLGAPELASWAALWNVAHAHAFGGPVGQAGAVGLLARRPPGLVGFALSDNRGHKDEHLPIGRGGRSGVDVRGFLAGVWARQPELPVFLEIHDGVGLEASVKTTRRWARALGPREL